MHRKKKPAKKEYLFLLFFIGKIRQFEDCCKNYNKRVINVIKIILV